jgi:hypothetical protein
MQVWQRSPGDFILDDASLNPSAVSFVYRGRTQGFTGALSEPFASADCRSAFLPPMSPRTVAWQRPHSEPAPHACATSLDVVAPSSIASSTVALVTAKQRQTYMILSHHACPDRHA